MDRDDIERMAREAKGHPYTNRYTPGETAFAFSIDRLENFVAMAVAAERERIIAQNAPEIEKVNAYIKALEEAVAAEREACAKVCDELAADVPDNDTDSDAINACAAAIRARGNP